VDLTLKIGNTQRKQATLRAIYGRDTDEMAIKWQTTTPQEQDVYEAVLCIGQRCTLPLHSLTELEQSLEETESHGTAEPS